MPQKPLIALLSFVAPLACGSTTTPPAPTVATAKPPATVATTPPAEPAAVRARPPRFDKLVMTDMFAGFAGDADALARGFRVVDAALASNPRDPQPLMWHATGTSFLAGQAARQGDSARARELGDQASRESEQAITLAPDDEWVLVYYALEHIARAKHTDDRAAAMKLFEQATAAYEHTEQIQKPWFASLSVHDRGELLVGLADLWARRGNEANARLYLARAAHELPGTLYATKAQDWLDRRAPPEGRNGYTCLSCHQEP
jgi:tetratricopeptide (TPR) repeat protein